MDPDSLYELVYDASRQAMRDDRGDDAAPMSPRMLAGSVTFVDGEGRTVKEVPALAVFRKVTSVREKLRVLEQKLNASEALPAAEKAELQGYITRAYGSLTTFNFLFAEDRAFRGTSAS